MSTRNLFETKIKPMLIYIGSIGAGLTSIAYIIMVCVLLFGFNSTTDLVNTLLFAIINAVFGLLILQFLKVQGTSFAKDIPENKEVLAQYYATKTKDKKFHSIKYYWITSVTKDIIAKGVSIFISTCCVIYIVIQGSENYTLLLLAAVNLILFISLGLLGLSNAYDFYNNQHINYIKDQLRKLNEESEAEKAVEALFTCDVQNNITDNRTTLCSNTSDIRDEVVQES